MSNKIDLLDNKKISNEDLSNMDLKGLDLAGKEFTNCDFSGTSFYGANLTKCKFKGCYIRGSNTIDLRKADLKWSKLINCKFSKINLENANLEKSWIENCFFDEGNLIGCRFDNAIIDDMHIKMCEIHLSSFMGAKINSIHYEPFIHIPYKRGLNYFQKGKQIFRTVFINYNGHLEFTRFCKSEARKDKLYSSVKHLPLIIREISIFFVFIFGKLTNYGASFKKWVFCNLSIILLYTAPISVLKSDKEYLEHMVISIKLFFNLDSFSNFNLPVWFITESIIGYLMLGILVALLTTKVISD
ncbi:MAG: pentapeptide repeat-containing protein [bacterium]